MCPPNSSTPYPATPYPCPFWGCPFAFRTREELGPHFATHDVAFASASLIRGVDMILLQEVDDFMFSDRYMKVNKTERKGKEEGGKEVGPNSIHGQNCYYYLFLYLFLLVMLLFLLQMLFIYL
jgi:hypothetical protein